MPSASVLGWDIGGAHVKAARVDANGALEQVIQLPCPLWQGLDHLQHALTSALAQLGRTELHAVTMTGEMADCFPNRAEGVVQIVRSLSQPLLQPQLYAGRHGFVAVDRARAYYADIASANWHASARLLATRLPEAILIDIGSTTTDIVPIAQAMVACRGHDDAARLAADELVYAGVVRTPLASVCQRVPFDGAWVPLMAEHFAASADVFRLSGELPEGADQQPSADGGDKSELASARRLARMIGRDVECADIGAWRALAKFIARQMRQRLADALARTASRGVVSAAAPIVGAGVGRFLARQLADDVRRSYQDFHAAIGAPSAASDHAPAAAVALLRHRSL